MICATGMVLASLPVGYVCPAEASPIECSLQHESFCDYLLSCLRALGGKDFYHILNTFEGRAGVGLWKRVMAASLTTSKSRRTRARRPTLKRVPRVGEAEAGADRRSARRADASWRRRSSQRNRRNRMERPLLLAKGAQEVDHVPAFFLAQLFLPGGHGCLRPPVGDDVEKCAIAVLLDVLLV